MQVGWQRTLMISAKRVWASKVGGERERGGRDRSKRGKPDDLVRKWNLPNKICVVEPFLSLQNDEVCEDPYRAIEEELPERLLESSLIHLFHVWKEGEKRLENGHNVSAGDL